MTEVSTLSPSPPSMGDQAVPAPSSPQPLPSETPIPKSSLYGDRAVMGNPTLQTGVKTSTSPGSPDKNIVATSLLATNSAGDPQVEVLAATDAEINGKNALSGHIEAQGSEPEQQMPPSPELNPSPNLYPNVEVSHISNPAPSMNAPPERPPSSIPVSSEHLTTFNPAPSHPSQDSTADPSSEAQAEPQTAQNPSTPNTPSTARMALEPPCTPSKADPPAVLVQELGGNFVPPSYTRPAPDTLSYLESASLMSGTLESLSGIGEDGSSVGSDSEINGPIRRTDKYGFLGGTQYSEARWVE